MRHLAMSVGLFAMQFVAACDSQIQPSSTGPFAVTGVVIVSGRVVNAVGVPLDSFRVAASVVTTGIMSIYSSAPVESTGRDGRYSIRVERQYFSSAPEAPDSVPLRVTTESLKLEHRGADGSAKRVSVDVWVKFSKPPIAPTALELNLPVPLVP
jgi:hypothetical protein